MKYEPHEYQRYAINYIVDHPFAAVLLDMGLGKTSITLTAVADLLFDSFEVHKVLVVAPLRVARDTWSAELQKWDQLHHLTYSVAVGSEAERKAALTKKADIYIINRENVQWLIEKSKLPFDYDMIVVDELSSFKNHQSKRFKALMQVRPKIKRVVGLTGTPASNGLMDLWAEFKVIDMGKRLGRFITYYRQEYFVPDAMNGQIVYSYRPKPGAEQAIYRKISDITISMKSTDHLKMPELISSEYKVYLSPDEQDAYDEMKKQFILDLPDGEISAANAAALSGKLSQMANGAIYDDAGNTVPIHEQMLSILASFAQEESRSISENVKWGTIKRFKQGIPNGKFSIFGYEWQDDKLIIIPEEAEIVRWMYAEYMKGASRIEIGRALMQRGIYTRQGKPWVDSNVKVILTNITYTGNMLFQKEYCEDPITKHRRKNYGELPQYFVEDTHEAIIPMDEWQAVQAEFKRRRDLGPFGNKSLNLSAFSTKITCGCCGKHYRHSGKRNTAGEVYYIWTCQTKSQKGASACPSKNIPEKMLQNTAAKVLGLDEFDEDAFSKQIEEIIVIGDDTLTFRFYDGHEVTTKWQSTAKTDWWTDERRKIWGERHKRKDTNPNKHLFYEFTGFIKCGCCGANYRCQSGKRKDGTPTRSWYCIGPKDQCHNPGIRDETMKRLVIDVLGLDEFDEAAMDAQIENATILDHTVTFHFRDGHTESRDFLDKRHGTPWTEERQEKARESMKAAWTDKRRKAMSERIKKIRSEKKWPKP